MYYILSNIPYVQSTFTTYLMLHVVRSISSNNTKTFHQYTILNTTIANKKGPFIVTTTLTATTRKVSGITELVYSSWTTSIISTTFSKNLRQGLILSFATTKDTVTMKQAFGIKMVISMLMITTISSATILIHRYISMTVICARIIMIIKIIVMKIMDIGIQ